MTDRCPCLVPGCKHSWSADVARGREWICERHWQAIPKARRRALQRISRQYRRQFGENGYWDYPPGSEQRIAAIHLDTRWRRVWTRIRRQAIEAAFMDPMT